jgi:RNA polymerase sigma-70 factor (ECF subfamily)
MVLAVATGYERFDDAALLRAHVDGDRDAFGELVRRHSDRMWGVALRTLGDREEASDALQDAFVSAYRAASRFRGDSAVTTWLHRIVVNACLDRTRRRQVRATVPLPEVETTALAEPPTDSETSLTVAAALGKLPAEQRIPLILLDMQGFSVAEIARILDVAEGTVKSRCARGRARLAILLRDLHEPERHTAGKIDAVPRPATGAHRDTAGTRNQPDAGHVGSGEWRSAPNGRGGGGS